MQGDENGATSVINTQRLGGECSYEVRYFGFGPELRDKYTHYDVRMADGEVVIHCRNVTLPNDKRPWACT